MGIPTVIGVSLLIFGIMSILPGNVAIAILGDRASLEAIEDLRDELGLNAPWYERYGGWIKDMLSGDMGKSLFLTQRPIKDLLASHFPITLNLTIYSMILAFAVGVSTRRYKRDAPGQLGRLSGQDHQHYRPFDTGILPGSGDSPPLRLCVQLAARLAVGESFENPRKTGANVLAVPHHGYFQVAFIARMTRSALLEVLLEDYMRTARAKGSRKGWWLSGMACAMR